MTNLKGIKPGDEVHVIDEDGNLDTYMFLAKVKHAVIASCFLYGKENIADTLDSLIYDTDCNVGTDLYVFPASRCFANANDALAAIEEARTC